MDKYFRLTIVIPERKVVENFQVSEVILPGFEGQIQILWEHADMIGMLQPGFFRFGLQRTSDQRGVLAGGFFEIHQNSIFVLADTLVLAGEMNLEQAVVEKKRAEEALSELHWDDHHFKERQLELQYASLCHQLAAGELASY